LLDVSAQSVYQWERNLGSLNLRQRTLQAVNEVRDLGKREVRHRLEQAGLLSERRRGPIARTGKSAAGDTAAKPGKKRAAAKKKTATRKKAAAAAKPEAKRGPGRPPGSGTKAAAGKKRGPGRPPGSGKKAPARAKRGPGRPRGSAKKA